LSYFLNDVEHFSKKHTYDMSHVTEAAGIACKNPSTGLTCARA